MPKPRRFDEKSLAALRDGRILRLRAGTRPHRFLGIWVVVAGGRAFVRSWTLKPAGWWRALLENPQGTIEIGSRRVRVHAVRTRSERLKSAVDRAYLEKYGGGWQRRFARGLGSLKRRDTTTELVPL